MPWRRISPTSPRIRPDDQARNAPVTSVRSWLSALLVIVAACGGGGGETATTPGSAPLQTTTTAAAPTTTPVATTSASTGSTSASVDDALLEQGRVIFEEAFLGKGCQDCHGLDGRGKEDVPSILGASRTKIVEALADVEEMDTIDELSSAEIDAVYAWITYISGG